MTRKIIAIFTALLLAASLCACTDEHNTEDSTTDNQIIIPGTESETSDTTDTESESETESETETETKEPVVLDFVEKKDTVYVISSTNQVNIRTEPVVSDETAIMVVENGTQLSRIAVSTDGEWSKVLFEGNECYIKSTYLTSLKNLDEGFVPMSMTLKLKASLFVRIAPYAVGESRTEAIDTLVEGNVVEVVAVNTTTGWYKVKFEGLYATEGYIDSNSKYFALETDAFEITADGYTRMSVEGTGAQFEKLEAAIFIATDSYETLQVESLTAREYAELVMQVYGIEADIVTVSGKPTFEYETTIEGITFHYLTFSFAGEEGCWLVQFVSTADTFESLRPEFEAIAKTFVIK